MEGRWALTATRKQQRPVKCAWCSHPGGWWPESCPLGEPGGEDHEVCTDQIAYRHETDDHRRCDVNDCGWAAYWRPLVVAAGIRACRLGGRSFAVVSTMDSPDAEVMRTFDRTQQAKPWRTRIGRSRGLPEAVLHGVFLVVRHDGVIV
jgi:hypothetical protein